MSSEGEKVMSKPFCGQHKFAFPLIIWGAYVLFNINSSFANHLGVPHRQVSPVGRKPTNEHTVKPATLAATKKHFEFISPDVAHGNSALAAPNAVAGMSGVQQSAPLGFLWDSGEQQCQISGKKIVYRFWLEENSSADYPGADWVMKYDVKTLFNATNGWAEDHALYAISYAISYPSGPTFSNQNSSMDKSSHASGVLVAGTTFNPFNYQLIVKSYGGPSGYQKTWPDPYNNGNACEQ
jgi:hypothetical protein